MPKINVVIPVRNGGRTIRSTLESLVTQTYRDFSVLIVNDGSSDDTINIVSEFEQVLNMCVLSTGENGGVSKARNLGVSKCTGKYVALIDGDDIAHPRRLECQTNYMDENPNVDVCGTDMAIFTEELGVRNYHYLLSHPKENARIKTAFLERCAISNPSVMLRPSVFDRIGLYNPSYDFAEDYELWCRGAAMGLTFCNLDQVLTYYRKHTSQVSSTKVVEQYRNDVRVKEKLIKSMIQTSAGEVTATLLSPRTSLENIHISSDVYESVMRDLIFLARHVEHIEEFSGIVSRLIKRCFGQPRPSK